MGGSGSQDGEGLPSVSKVCVPALGAALGDFPSPGKNVCLFGEGKDRKGEKEEARKAGRQQEGRQMLL